MTKNNQLIQMINDFNVNVHHDLCIDLYQCYRQVKYIELFYQNNTFDKIPLYIACSFYNTKQLIIDHILHEQKPQRQLSCYNFNVNFRFNTYKK